jgi:hypothetical protein
VGVRVLAERVHLRAGVASDAGRIAQVLATHLRGMPVEPFDLTRTTQKQFRLAQHKHNGETCFCGVLRSERVGPAISSSPLVSTPIMA